MLLKEEKSNGFYTYLLVTLEKFYALHIFGVFKKMATS